MAKNIINLPQEDRPYEKLESFGSENLTFSELLAIIIKNGTKDKNCIELSREILSSNTNKVLSDVEFFSNLNLNQLKSFKGIGRVKAIQIMAVIEIAKRINLNLNNKKEKIRCPNDVFKLMNIIYFGMKTEMVSIISLDNACNVISIERISSGFSNTVNLGIKEVFSQPIKNMATSIILVHNHPSGNVIPSKQDIMFSKMIDEYGKTFGIKLNDHIIIGKNEYISMKEKGYF